MDVEIMDINEFKEKVGIEKLPKELENLIIFQDTLVDSSYFSDGFEIIMSGKEGLQYGWSEEENFLHKLIPFASANSSGSIYSLWINDNEKSLSQIPVVVFGDEGGVHIVAENILQLLHLLTYDVEIDVDEDGVEYFKHNEKYKESKNRKEYLKWVKDTYSLVPVVFHRSLREASKANAVGASTIYADLKQQFTGGRKPAAETKS
jgi:hypothetical protein